MSTGINKAFLFGNLGADPELKMGSGGVAILKLRLATNAVWFDKDGNKKESTEWHRVTVFGKRAEALSKFLTKGDRMLVEGRIQTSSYEKEGQKHYSTEIIADDIVLGGHGKNSQNGAYQRPAASTAPVIDEIPF